MNIIDTLANPAGRRRFISLLPELFQREPAFTSAALLLFALLLPTLAAMAIDTRTVLGENVWIKPLKFELALGLYLVTLAWFADWLPPGMTKKTAYRIYSHVIVVCVLAEVAWVGGAAMLGTLSHFNFTTSLTIMIYKMMGVFAVTLTSAALVYAVQIARNKTLRLQPALKLAIVCGLAITFVSTVMVASYLASNGGHLVGGSATKAGGFPIMGWSRDGGDLRVTHFFATHALHFIPIFGYLIATTRHNGSGRLWVAVFSAGYIGLIAYTFVQAINGQPFLQLTG